MAAVVGHSRAEGVLALDGRGIVNRPITAGRAVTSQVRLMVVICLIVVLAFAITLLSNAKTLLSVVLKKKKYTTSDMQSSS